MIELLWNGPVSQAKMTKIVEALALCAGQNVLDVGCGCGEVLIQLRERCEIQGTGIDSSAPHIAEAKRRSAGRVHDGQIRFVQADAQAFEVPTNSLHLAICMGATHAYGLGSDAYRNAIEQMIPLVLPGGLLLVADGYMKQPASPEYRELIGDSMPDELTHAANVATGKDLGLTPLAAWTSCQDEWDDFEWGYQRICEQNAIERPDDPATQTKLAHRRQWMEAYLQWGRDTLGYGIYLFRKVST